MRLDASPLTAFLFYSPTWVTKKGLTKGSREETAELNRFLSWMELLDFFFTFKSKMIILKRPEKRTLSNKNLYLHIITHHNVPDLYTDNVFYKSIEILHMGNNEEVSSPAIPLSQENQKIYFGIQNQMNVCVNNAETVNVRLRMLLIKMGKDEATVNVSTFMERKSLFSDGIYKMDQLRSISNFSTNKRIKKLTKLLTDFIADRNIYTHGRLLYFSPENVLLIESIDDGKVIHSDITSSILISYNKAYKTLMTFFTLIENLIHNKETDSVMKQWNLKENEIPVGEVNNTLMATIGWKLKPI